MSEYWKSVGNYWCNYCKTFVRNDAFSRRQHEASPRHEGALKRQVRDIHRKTEREARDLAHANRELARIGGKTTAPKPDDAGPRKINIGARPKKVERPTTLDDQDVYQAALAAQAIPGQWSTVESIDPESRHVAALGGVGGGKDEGEQDVKPDPNSLETSQHAEEEQEGILPAKRRRDGADEELLRFKVEARQLPVSLKSEDDSGAVNIMFKKRKQKFKSVRKDSEG